MQNTKKILTTYLRRLTNLSANNRSLYLPRLSGEQYLDVQDLSFLNGTNAFKIIEVLITGKKCKICLVVDSRMEAGNTASQKMKKLQRQDEFIFSERGSKDLHVGWPFVRGKFLDGSKVRCPLLFFPVELKIENGFWYIIPRKEAEISFNKSFLLAYSHFNHIPADELLLEETFEEADKESTMFRTQVYQLLQKSGLDINFNADNFRDELIPFTAFKKEIFDEIHKIGELKLFPEAVLGIFPQAGSYLVPDYNHLMNEEKVSDLEAFFQKQFNPDRLKGTDYLHAVREDKVYNLFPADIWQENALKAVKAGNSIVVQGPPGTGKSQLICNLISDGIANGKRVLIVSQKRAALDVVFDRLHEKKISDFVARIHDFKNDRTEIYQKILKQIERVDEYISRNISLDAIQLDRNFLQVSKSIDLLTAELEEFRSALYDQSECDKSIRELYFQSNVNEPVISIRQEYQFFRFREVESFLKLLRQYIALASHFQIKSYPLHDRKSFSSFGITDKLLMLDYFLEITTSFHELNDRIFKLFNTTFDWQQCEELLEKKELSEQIRNWISSPPRFTYFQKMLPESEDETSALWLANIERMINDCFLGEGPELSVPSHHLVQLQLALDRTIKARKNVLGRIAWELFSKDKYLVKRALVANELENSRPGLLRLEKKLDNRLNLEHNLSKLKAKSWLTEISFDHSEMQNWFRDNQDAIKAKLAFRSIRGIKNLIDPLFLNHLDFLKKLGTLFEVLESFKERKNRWTKHLSSSQINTLTQNPSAAVDFRSILLHDFELLCEFDRLHEQWKPHEWIVINKLYEKIGTWDEAGFKHLFLNSIALTWIDHIETKYPVLRIVSSGKISTMEAELMNGITEKQMYSSNILLLRAREKIIDNLEYNRLKNRVTYRDLGQQVAKKKKIWPIRKLMAAFDQELLRLLPCWLASPESVSAIFPMKEIFDIVIFDEASQCYAEKGIPALYRGKQTVIAGDHQQLRPGDFYQVRWDDESEEPDLEIDSLLELSARYLPQVSLKGHYRSHSLELIDFSNRHFYNGKLQLLPDRITANQKEPVISYIKTDGVWKNNSNLREAEVMVDLVFELHQKYPQKDIGIITFNAPQQSLIMDLLEEYAQLHSQPVPDNLFVKNIENVQGDERDIILFSVAYAPDTNGKINLQFGSLNLPGGENRLNVAVSRAREKIIVVTSIMPQQLEVQDTKNRGPKLLKQYLQYALDVSQGTFMPHYISHNNGYLKQLIKDWTAKKWTEYSIDDDQLPFTDLTVSKNNERLSALLTDDEPYFTSPSAKDPHALVPLLLEKKNWPFTRFYSRNLWQDKDRFLNEVSKMINR